MKSKGMINDLKNSCFDQEGVIIWWPKKRVGDMAGSSLTFQDVKGWGHQSQEFLFVTPPNRPIVTGFPLKKNYLAGVSPKFNP